MTLPIPVDFVVALLLASTRIGAVLLLLPLLGGDASPRPLRVLLSFAVAVAMAPWVPVGETPNSVPALALALGREAAIGFGLGFLARTLLTAPLMAGDVVAQELGLKMAQEIDPTTRLATTAPGRLYEIVLFLVFLGAQGHHEVLRALRYSFDRMPVGSFTMPGNLLGSATEVLTVTLRAALWIAAPLFVVLLAGTVVLALLARAVPQLHVFHFGYPLRMVTGLAAAALLLPLILRPGLALLGHMSRSLSAFAAGG